jgi:DNA-binding transcriptional regulator YdaS (Cro superfamily)
MDIFTFCDAQQETLPKLAARLRMHRGHLHKIATGERGWTSETALRIEDRTKGLVTPNDLARTRRAYLRQSKRRPPTRGSR